VAAVTDDPGGWVRQLRDSIRVDPEIPPGMVIVESGSQMVAWALGHGDLPDGVTVEQLAEVLYSYKESSPYFIRLDGRGEPIQCEVCGTLVALTYEALTVSAGGEPPARRRWTPGIWEPENGRRHTLRRCEWKRANR
jgi:hypothetical protein